MMVRCTTLRRTLQGRQSATLGKQMPETADIAEPSRHEFPR
jgi:hypothetical protein